MPDRSTDERSVESGPGTGPPFRVHLELTLPLGELGAFFPILQQGFTLFCPVGCSLNALLCEGLGLGREYVTERITTIFLNGKAIDNLESAVVQEGTTVALSAAMPGLVGATMRRGGYYAAMRGTITYRGCEGDTVAGFGAVRIKLFNLLLTELGPGFLRRGIFLPETALQAFLARRDDPFWESCTEMVLNGSPATRGELLGRTVPADERMASLIVHFGS